MRPSQPSRSMTGCTEASASAKPSAQSKKHAITTQTLTRKARKLTMNTRGEVSVRALQKSDMVGLKIAHCFVDARGSCTRGVLDSVDMGGIVEVLLNLAEIVNCTIYPVLRAVVILNAHAVHHKLHTGDCSTVVNFWPFPRRVVLAL